MGSKYKILVVEDEKNIRHLIGALLEADGYQTVPARDFANGKMLYFSHRPDLVILDLGLPDGDGMDSFYLPEQTNQTRWKLWIWAQTTMSPNPSAPPN